MISEDDPVLRFLRRVSHSQTLDFTNPYSLVVFREAARRGLICGTVLGFCMGAALVGLIWLIVSHA